MKEIVVERQKAKFTKILASTKELKSMREIINETKVEESTCKTYVNAMCEAGFITMSKREIQVKHVTQNLRNYQLSVYKANVENLTDDEARLIIAYKNGSVLRKEIIKERTKKELNNAPKSINGVMTVTMDNPYMAQKYKMQQAAMRSEYKSAKVFISSTMDMI